MDLNERLSRLDGRDRPNKPHMDVAPDAAALDQLAELVPGTWHHADGCRCYVTEKRYTLDQIIGRTRLGDICDLPANLWQPWLGQGVNATLDLRRALFIDAETTGLGTGPSTYAFMLGVAYFQADHLCVRQYMMPDPAHEPALLDLLLADMAAHPGLVSFNGRSFDWPLLRTRLILADRLPDRGSGAHLDLLLMARRLWRKRLVSCSLGHLEIEVLEIKRANQDVPGWMIPGIYHDFCAQGIVEPLAGVFYHNQIDMVSMAALAIVIGKMIVDPWHETGAHCDFYALGRLYERAGDHDQAHRAYSTAWRKESNVQALRAMSTLLKRQGDMDRAAELWLEAMDCAGVYPCIELAKHFEHNLRDYGRARELALTALGRLADDAPSDNRAEIEHRLARLDRKLAKHQGRDQSQRPRQ